MLRNQIIKPFVKALDLIEYGCLTIIMPDGSCHEFSGRLPGVNAEMIIHDTRTFKAFINKSDIGLCESYRDGWWDSADLAAVFLFGLQNEDAIGRYINGSFIARLATRIAYLLTANTLNGSRKNIHAHYDLGNDFYALWLDPGMTYSSALFTDDNHDLITAQHRKYDRIIERLHDSGTLLEIGCGWGAFAERALISHDYAIKGLTISQRQHEYANNRLNGDAVIALEDYRIQRGKYDQIVSIEMFEAVGEKFWPVYFSQIKSLLANKGKALIQTIVIDDRYFDRYRRGYDSIRTFIFPGGMLPSPLSFGAAANKAELRISDSFAFGKDYGITIKHWLSRFERNIDLIKAMGFDDSFIRLWRFYLIYCQAGFKSGRVNVMQMELQHAA